MKVNEVLRKYSLVAKKYTKNNSVFIVDTNNGKYVYKDVKPNNEILNYLKTRNFDYLPKLISGENENYQLMNYLKDYNIPKEQKILDMIVLVALLHNKTTHYKEVSIDEYEKIYDDLANNIDYLYGYYDDLMTIIESKVYMSPSEYLLARNISMIYKMLDSSKKRLDKWYDLVKEKRKQRNVVLHNNLNLDHFIRNSKSYLINWDKAKIGNPVFDIYKLYKRHVLDFEFSDVLKEYEGHYPFTEDEKQLFLVLISLPSIIKFDDTEYNMCSKISREIDTLYKSEYITKKV